MIRPRKVRLEDDHYCFGCGDLNREGLGIDWVVEGRTAYGTFVAPRKFQGWKDIVHGGIVATLLDEAMTRLAWIAAGGALTAEMSIRYLAPAPVGRKLFVRGEIVSENRRLVEMRSSLQLDGPDGPVLARAAGKAVRMKPEPSPLPS